MDVNPIVRYLNTLKQVGTIAHAEQGFLSVYLFLNYMVENIQGELSKDDIADINALLHCLRKKSCLLQELSDVGCHSHEDDAFYFYYAVVEERPGGSHAVDYVTLKDLVKSHSLNAKMSMSRGSRFIVIYDALKVIPIQYKIETKLGDDIGTDLSNRRKFYQGYMLINGKVYTSLELLYYNTGNVNQNVDIIFEEVAT